MKINIIRGFYFAILFSLLTVTSAFPFAVPKFPQDVDFAAVPDDDAASSVDENLYEAADGDGDESDDEDEDEQNFNSLFEDMAGEDVMYIDTSFSWDNKTINSGRFDYKMLTPDDSIKIPLVAPSHEKFYAHPAANHVTSRFGRRGYRWHYGTDVKLKTGDPVNCAFDGIVRVIQYDRRGYGHVVVVRHHNGLETLYGHLSKVTVKTNEPIKAGEQVGLGGNTGRSTGPHLHFEIRYYGEPFNPEYIIDFDNCNLKSDTLVLTRDNFEYLTELRKTVYYTVRSGDTLSGIAKRYGTTLRNLYNLNGMKSTTILRVGRKLVVSRGKEDDRRPAATPGNPIRLPASAGAAVSAASENTADVYYTVRSGDTLSGIAKRYGTTLRNLYNLNGVKSATILRVGRKLVVSRGEKEDEQPSMIARDAGTAANVYYTVRNGDTLSGIAEFHGTTVRNICNLNNIKSTTILRVGRKLVIG